MPSARARRMASSASASAGRNSAGCERGPPRPAVQASSCSARGISSAPSPRSREPSKRYGLRSRILSTNAPATSSMSKSSATSAWNSTCSSRSDSSPRTSPPSLTASMNSNASSIRYGNRLAWVCPASHSPVRRAADMTSMASATRGNRSPSSPPAAAGAVADAAWADGAAAGPSSRESAATRAVPSSVSCAGAAEVAAEAAAGAAVAAGAADGTAAAGDGASARPTSKMRSPAAMRSWTSSLSTSVVTRISASDTECPPASAMAQRTRMGTSSV